jgi:hypothetical protein
MDITSTFLLLCGGRSRGIPLEFSCRLLIDRIRSNLPLPMDKQLLNLNVQFTEANSNFPGILNWEFGPVFQHAWLLSAHCKPPSSALNSKISATTANEGSGSCVDWRFTLQCRWWNSQYLRLEGIRATVWSDWRSGHRNRPGFLRFWSAARCSFTSRSSWIYS